MSYFGFLARFLLIPILLLAWLNWRDGRRGKALPDSLQGASPFKLLACFVAIALIYTTPWDNYLVATGVWWYNPALVTGLVLGWVPIEEYTFFVLQPILVGLWLFWWARRLPTGSAATVGGSGLRVRLIAGGVVVVVWAISLALLISGWRPATYIALELVWALPPVILQLCFGGDILLRHWRLLLLTLLPMTLYLSVIDSFAIGSGTWTIDPAQSLGLLLGGLLPVEESLFFFLTTLLVTLGLVLGLAKESWARLLVLTRLFRARPFGERIESKVGVDSR